MRILNKILADFLNELQKRKLLGREVRGVLCGGNFWISSNQSPGLSGVSDRLFTDCLNYFLDFNLESLLLLLLLLKIYYL